MLAFRSIRPLVLTLALAGWLNAAAAGGTVLSDADRATVAATAERWWQRVSQRDSAAVGAGSADDLRVTLSNGRTYDRTQFLKAVADFADGPSTSAVWSQVDVRALGASTAVVTGRIAETGPAGTVDYSCQMALERVGTEWRVARSLSSRTPVLTPRIPLAGAGRTADFVGPYRALRGGTLRVTERDGVLVLTDPSGGESRMEPIAPGTFELDYVTTGSGAVRLVFTRDESGHVVSLTRLGAGAVVTWPRQ